MRTKTNKEKRSSPTPCSRVLLDKPTVAWLIKELQILCEIWRFTNCVHNSLQQEPIPSQISPGLICKPYSLNIHLNIILPAMTRTYNSFPSSGFLTKILDFFISAMWTAWPRHLILIDLINEQYLSRSTNYSHKPHSVTLSTYQIYIFKNIKNKISASWYRHCPITQGIK